MSQICCCAPLHASVYACFAAPSVWLCCEVMHLIWSLPLLPLLRCKCVQGIIAVLLHAMLFRLRSL